MHEGIEDGGVVPPPTDIADETTVDLDPVEGEELQQGERGISDADIVQRNAHAKRTDKVKVRQHHAPRIKGNRLGYLNFEARPRQSTLG